MREERHKIDYARAGNLETDWDFGTVAYYVAVAGWGLLVALPVLLILTGNPLFILFPPLCAVLSIVFAIVERRKPRSVSLDGSIGAALSGLLLLAMMWLGLLVAGV